MKYKFTKRQTRNLMHIFHIMPDQLAGPIRHAHSTIFIETMESVPDGVEYFRRALQTELEHGTTNSTTNVTDDDAIDTARIVVAHLLGVEYRESSLQWKYFPAYYDALWAMEREIPK